MHATLKAVGVLILVGFMSISRPSTAHATPVTITGQVVDCNGVGIPNANVNILTSAPASACIAGVVAGFLTTDASGNFSITLLAPPAGNPYYAFWVYNNTVTSTIPNSVPSDIACCGNMALETCKKLTIPDFPPSTVSLGVMVMGYDPNVGCPGEGGGEDPRLPH